MAHSISWTTLALNDLQEIRDYISNDKPLAAKKEAQKIKEAVESLESFPHIGKSFRGLLEIREMVVGNYRIFYQIKKSQIQILRIYHGKRNL